MTKKIGIGFIGTGFTRTVQMPAFAVCPDARLVSVASGRAENAKAAADEFGIEHHTGDWRETVSHPDVDLVCITTPPILHKEMVLFAAAEGKHILAEKPMAMNVAEAGAMLDAVKNSDRLALIDHELRFVPGRRAAKQMIADGKIGKIRHVRYDFTAPHRGDPNVGWNWWSDIEQGGGALGAINSHIVDSFNFFSDTVISEVFCQLQTNVKERKDAAGVIRPVTSDDQANMILRFADGGTAENATGIAAVSMTDGVGYTNEITIFGTEGALRIGHRGDLYVSHRGDAEWTPVETETAEPVGSGGDTGFSRGFGVIAKEIVAAIRDGRSELDGAATFEDGVEVQRVLDAARESDRDGRLVKIAR